MNATLFLLAAVTCICTSGDVEYSKSEAQCPQKVKFHKRKKILAFLNSMLEEKRRESLDTDFVDSSHTCYEDEFAGSPKEPDDINFSEVLVSCKSGRKRTMAETVNHDIEGKKPLLGKPAFSSSEGSSKASCSINSGRHLVEHSTGSRGLLGDFPSAVSRPNAQSRCVRQKHSVFPGTSHTDHSGTDCRNLYRTNCEGQLRNGYNSCFVDYSRYAAETIPEDITVRYRECRPVETQRVTGSIIDCNSNAQRRNRSPLHSQRHMRQNDRRGLLGDCPSSSFATASGFAEESPHSSYDLHSGQFVDPERGDDGFMVPSFTRPPAVSIRDLVFLTALKSYRTGH